jgi:hypothetical protein
LNYWEIISRKPVGVAAVFQVRIRRADNLGVVVACSALRFPLKTSFVLATVLADLMDISSAISAQ